MRVYYLRLTRSDFTTVNGRWESSAIDLYDNNQYKNYSTTKSKYGLNLLGNDTWTGMVGGPVNTDSGRILASRFIDTSGQVDVISYNVVADPATEVDLEFYTADSATAAFPDEWVARTGLTPADEIGDLDSPRYAKVVLNFATDPTDAEFLLRVEIDRPVMAPYYHTSRNTLVKFPSWMAIHEDHDGPVTTSLGGSLVNAISGEWLEELSANLTYAQLQKFIDTVDLNQKAWVYKTTSAPGKIYSVTGDGIEVGRALDQEELYESDSTEHVFWWDEDGTTIYSNRAYAILLINGEFHTQEGHHVWNAVDELGLLVDLRRLRLEGNTNFRLRILDVFKNRLGVGMAQFKNALRRELDIWREEGLAPDSDYAGALPEVLEISDLESDSDFFEPDGMPTSKMLALVEQLSRDYPTTWGRFRWDKALWDLGGNHHQGHALLPYRMDGIALSDAATQSGVGDINDLYVFKPDVVTGPHDFTVRLKLSGIEYNEVTDYPPVDFDVQVYGTADRKIYNNPTSTIWLTAEATTASGVYESSFQLSSKSDVDVDTPTVTPNSYGVKNLFDLDDKTSTGLTFLKKTDASPYSGPGGGRIPAADITSLSLKPGKWDQPTQAYVNVPTDIYKAWFSTDSATVLEVGGGTTLTVTGNAQTLPRPTVVMSSKQTSFTVGVWTSTKAPYKIQLKDDVDFTLTLPTITWDQFLEATPNKQIHIENVTLNNGIPGALSDGVFLAGSTYLTLEGTAFGPQRVLPGSTTEVTFGMADGPLYPVDRRVPSGFSEYQTINYAGVVDENGPWRNAEPSEPGNTNYNLRSVSLTRDDFGVPNTADYRPLAMDVEVLDDPQVVAWLETNTIDPAITEGDTVYPADSIQETLNGGVYSFSPFVIRARLRPDPAPQWYPQVHSGFFFDRQQEYYFYADPVDEVVTTASHVLAGVARQGAPIIVHDGAEELRQVAFYADTSPVTLTMSHTQRMNGTGTTSLYLAYADVYNVTVTNVATGAPVAATSSSATNVINTTAATDFDTEYDVTYTLRNSFYVDNDYEDATGLHTRLVFDAAPATSYQITYESSTFNPSAVVDLPLNPLYTTLDEGYIYIGYDEFTLDRVTIHMSPTKLVADGNDYAIITVRSEDANGNPKPNQNLTLSSSFGTLDDNTLTTDADGFAVAVLTAGSSTASLSGTLTVTGAVSASAIFDIDVANERPYRRIFAVPSAEQVPADAYSKVSIFGRVETEDFAPVPSPSIRWKKARSIYELFTTATPTTITGKADGTFEIGPFTTQNSANSGYWFVSIETLGEDGTTWAYGDVVFWHEYPDGSNGVENMTGLPRVAVQMVVNPSEVPSYGSANKFPYYYDEATPYAPTTPVTINWLPPRWFALNRYLQYQLGLLGTTRDAVDYASLSQVHPSSKDI